MKKVFYILLLCAFAAIGNAQNQNQNCNFDRIDQYGTVCAKKCGSDFCIAIRDTATYKFEWAPSASSSSWQSKTCKASMLSSYSNDCVGTGVGYQFVCTYVIKVQKNLTLAAQAWNGIQDGWVIRISKRNPDGTFQPPQLFTADLK